MSDNNVCKIRIPVLSKPWYLRGRNYSECGLWGRGPRTVPAL